MRVLLLTALAAIYVSSAPAAHAATPGEHVKAELIADTAAAKPGATFRLGILLTLDPHWHVYWTNPGNSGRATTVKFNAPAGVTVGDLRFPLPIRFDQPGDVIGYGYEDKVLLTADVTVPADFRPGTKLEIDAGVSWLVCKDVCTPGKVRLSIALPVSREPAKANEKLFVEWAARLPQKRDPAVKSATWDAAKGETLTYTIAWASKPPAKVELFPGRRPELEVEKIDVKTEQGQTRVMLDVHLFAGQKLESDRLPSLLVYTGDDGVRRGVEVDVPLGSLRAREAARGE